MWTWVVSVQSLWEADAKMWLDKQDLFRRNTFGGQKAEGAKKQESLWTKCRSDTFVTEEGKEELGRNILSSEKASIRLLGSFWGSWFKDPSVLGCWLWTGWGKLGLEWPWNKRYFKLRLSITSPHKRFFGKEIRATLLSSFLSWKVPGLTLCLIFFLFNNFIYFWPCQVFVAAWTFL